MFRLIRSNLRARKTRLFLSATAVALGVAFMVGTLVLTATLDHSYDRITGNALDGVDAVVRSDEVLVSADDNEVRAAVDHRTLDAVASAPGVEAAEPRVEGIAQLVGDDGRLLDERSTRATPLALGWAHEPALNPMELVAGTPPRRADDVVIDRRTARDNDLSVGDEVGVLTATGPGRYRVAGVATYGGADDAGGAHVTAFRADRAATLFGDGGYQSIQVVASDGTSEAALTASIRRTLRDHRVADTEVISGTVARDEAAEAAGEVAGAFGTFLLYFAVVSLLVGSFVIANAFSITAAQRTRENALLRAIGASRRQVVRAVMVEALLTGVLASAVGVVLGILTAGGLRALLASSGVDLPSGPLVVPSGLYAAGIGVGTLVTLVACYVPARRSARVAPVAALRDVALDRSGASIARTVAGTLLTAAGSAALVAGLAGGGVPLVGFGALAAFVGVVVLGPVLAPRAARLLGSPLRLVAGVTGSIATENARRNPKRTAATSSSLMIGLAVVAFMTIFAASARMSFATMVDDALRGDWIVSTVFGQGGVSPDLARSIDELPETGAVSPLRYSVARQGDRPVDVSAVDPTDIEDVADTETVSGRLSDLGTDGVAVHSDTARSHGWSVGDVVDLTFPATGRRTLRVVAIYDAKDPLGPYAVSLATFEANVTERADRYVLVANAPGTSSAQAEAAIARVVADYPTAELQTGPEFASSATAEIASMLNLVYVLLALAVLIALFGIANTMALSVHERSRELGLLRAVGMGRRQMRSTVRIEAAIISLLGTVLGIVVGAGFALAVVHALASEGIRLSVPVTSLVVMVVLGAMAGAVASALPARRAARLNVLDALHAE